MAEESIIAKLGLDISSFRKNAAESVDSMKGIQKSFRDFKELLGGGAIAAAARQVFSAIIDHAAQSRDKVDENFEAVRRYGDSLKTAKETALDFGVKVLGVFNRMGEAIGDTVNIVRYGWEAWNEGEAAINASAKAADSAAASLAAAQRYAKDFAAANAEAAQLSKQHAEAELKIKTAIEQKAAIEERFYAVQLQISKVADDLSGKEWTAADFAELTLKRKQLQNEAQKALNDLVTVNVKAEAEAAKAAEETAKKQAEQQKIRAQFAEKSALSVAEELELFNLLSKSTDRRTAADRERIEILTLQKKEKQTMVEIEDLEKKLITDEITPAERARLAELIKQDQKIKDQIASKLNLVGVSETHLAVERDITSELEKQRLAAINAANASANQGMRGMWDMQVSSVNGRLLPPSMTPDQIASTSTAALRGVIADRKKLLEEIEAADDADASGALTRAVTGDPAGQIVRSKIEMEIGEMMNEILLRGSVQNTVERRGEDAARTYYGDSATDRGIRDLQTVTERQATDIESIAERLRKLVG